MRLSLQAMLLLVLLALAALLPVAAQTEPSPAERGPAERGPAERLEADLHALFAATPGTLTIGQMSESEQGDRVSAEDIAFDAKRGEGVRLDRYVVVGDYDRPEEVRLQGLRLIDELTELPVLEIERIALGGPSRAVLPLLDTLHPGTGRIETLAIDRLAADMSAEAARRYLGDDDIGDGSGRLTIERIRGSDLTPSAIGRLVLTGIAGRGADLDGVGDAGFTLDSLVLEGLDGLDEAGEARLGRLELRKLAVESDRLVAQLERLGIDGDVAEGGGMRLDALVLDLERMIELAPVDERTRLRMISNVLTDGSGRLRLDAEVVGDWEADSQGPRLLANGRVEAADAFRLTLDMALPVRLSNGGDTAAYLADLETLEDLAALEVLGGGLTHTLVDLGLFARVAPVMAATQGVSEADFLAQARTQAEGFGLMLGPEVAAILTGLVDMMAGRASELEVRLTVPVDGDMESLAADPLALPGKLAMEVETR